MLTIARMAIVYKITCGKTGKIYIGWTTVGLDLRWKRHLVCDKGCYIQHCIKKYGKENFAVELLYDFESKEEAMAKEIELIRELRLNICRHPYGNGMNMTDGGEGTVGYVATETHKEKLRTALKGKKKSALHSRRIGLAKLGSNNPMYGRAPSEKQRESARKLFKENNPHKKGELSHRFGKPSHMLGRKHSQESIEKMRGRPGAMKGKSHTPETREKIRKATKHFLAEKGHPNQGKKASEESKAKMQASRIAFFEKQKASGNPYKHSEETKERMRQAAKSRVLRKASLLRIAETIP
jgi:group I intron endonuclease